LGSQLPADLYARYLRVVTRSCFYVPEQAQHSELARRQRLAMCRDAQKVQARIIEGFGLSFDHFRTVVQHAKSKLTQHFWARHWHNGPD
jgi:methionyl-tRNA synthetase